MSGNAISIKELLFRWSRQPHPCLDIPALNIAAGEHVFLHGPSVSGKSTLLGLLGGIALPERGRIELLGNGLTRMTGRARDRLRADSMGFLFQQFNLLPWLSAIDNVTLPCTFSARRRERTRDNGGVHAEAARLLTHLDLAHALWRKPAAELSVGQQQRAP